MANPVPDRANSSKRKGMSYLDAKKYSKLEAIARNADDSGISDYDMEELDKNLRRRPGK